MFNPRTIIPTLLVGGLVVIEVLSTGLHSPAESQHGLSTSETNLILSILHGQYQETAADSALPASQTPFLTLDLPLSEDLTTGGLPTTSSSAPTSSASVLADILPPVSTPLFYAYQDGGKAWYAKNQNILVIFPDETIQSFNIKTGQATSWLQDRLALAPVTEAGAYSDYQTLYRADIVAETTTWVLMEFPSGGVVKVAKPQATGGQTIIGLPDILSGYGR